MFITIITLRYTGPQTQELVVYTQVYTGRDKNTGCVSGCIRERVNRGFMTMKSRYEVFLQRALLAQWEYNCFTIDSLLVDIMMMMMKQKCFLH